EAIDMLYLVMKSSLGRSDLIDNAFERLALCKARLLKLTDMQQNGVSLWFETTRLHVSLHLTPLSIADKFRDIVAADNRSWVFTSATLSVNNGFSHYTAQMGLNNAKTLLLESPFNYAEQALLCVPRYMSEPHEQGMAKQ